MGRLWCIKKQQITPSVTLAGTPQERREGGLQAGILCLQESLSIILSCAFGFVCYRELPPSVRSVQFGRNRRKCKFLLSAPWQVEETATICPKKQILILHIVRHGFYEQCNLQARQVRPVEPGLWPTPALSPSTVEMLK